MNSLSLSPLTWLYMAHIFLLPCDSASFSFTDLECIWIFFLFPLWTTKRNSYILFYCFLSIVYHAYTFGRWLAMKQESDTTCRLSDTVNRQKTRMWVYIAAVQTESSLKPKDLQLIFKKQLKQDTFRLISALQVNHRSARYYRTMENKSQLFSKLLMLKTQQICIMLHQPPLSTGKE